MEQPNHQLAENTVLGAMMEDIPALQDATAALRSEDFFLESNQRIFRALVAMVQEGAHIDQITLANTLEAHGDLRAIGGIPYLAELGFAIPRNPDITSYIRILKDRSLARRGIKACHQTQQRLIAQREPAAEVLDELMRTLTVARPEDSKPIAAVLPRALAALEPGGHTRISTGIREIDEMTRGGGRTKELWIIGAQPSAGKSALCRQLERAAVAQGRGVHAHSVEVDDLTWVQFHMAHIAGVSPWKLREPEVLSRFDKDRLQGAAAKLVEWPYLMDDAGAVHIDALLAKSRLSVMRNGTRLVTVDYLQLLSGDEVQERIRFGNMAKRLKQFAKDNDCWVVLLSQLARQGDINLRPTVQHLKESGDLEAAADVVLLNYRPKDPHTAQYTGEDEIIIGKQRNGAVGAIPMRFNTNNLCYESRA